MTKFTLVQKGLTLLKAQNMVDALLNAKMYQARDGKFTVKQAV